MSHPELSESVLKERLAKRYEPYLICNEQTELVVEGFPRSANTYFVDFLRIVWGARRRFAHHTHDRHNLDLGLRLSKPCVVLIREPEDALASFSVYNNQRHTIATIANRYCAFYARLANDARPAVIDFRSATSDMNAVIRHLNSYLKLDIPFSEDLAADSKKAMEADILRASKTRDEEKFTRTVGAPLAKRKELTAEILPQIREYLAERDGPRQVYRNMCKSKGYLEP